MIPWYVLPPTPFGENKFFETNQTCDACLRGKNKQKLCLGLKQTRFPDAGKQPKTFGNVATFFFAIVSDSHLLPIGSMYAIYGNIYHQYTPNVSIYTSTMDPMGMIESNHVISDCCDLRSAESKFDWCRPQVAMQQQPLRVLPLGSRVSLGYNAGSPMWRPPTEVI